MSNNPMRDNTRLDGIPLPIVAAVVVLAGCGATVLGMVVIGLAPATSIVLGLVLLACAFSLLYGSPIALVLISITGFLVVVSTMIGAQEVPELRRFAILSGVIFAGVMALVVSQVRWLFRTPERRNRPPQ